MPESTRSSGRSAAIDHDELSGNSPRSRISGRFSQRPTSFPGSGEKKDSSHTAGKNSFQGSGEKKDSSHTAGKLFKSMSSGLRRTQHKPTKNFKELLDIQDETEFLQVSIHRSH